MEARLSDFLEVGALTHVAILVRLAVSALRAVPVVAHRHALAI
jgi:hypothetical protein